MPETAPKVELSQDESTLLDQLLLLTGRQDRAIPISEPQKAAVRALWPALKTASTELKSESRCDLVNRLLLTLGIRPMSYEFYSTVLGKVSFQHIDLLKEQVRKFRILCMLEYGSFKYGYKMFNQGKGIETKWHEHFPSDEEIHESISNLKTRPAPLGLQSIKTSELFALGYLATEQAAKINEARQQLHKTLQAALKQGVKDYSELEKVAKVNGIADLPRIIAASGISDADALTGLPLFTKERRYEEILSAALEMCWSVNPDVILFARNTGRQNANTYLAMHDLDVYVATSMRDAVHFTTNAAFVKKLFEEGELREWKLRYFDPTQAYLSDRIQKGLLECLMIKRASVTVYNAQESDTFGKDAELGVTLAQRKPAIVYVARIMGTDPEFAKIYDRIDSYARLHKANLIDSFVADALLSKEDQTKLNAPEKTKADVIATVLNVNLAPIIQKRNESELALELVGQGYMPDATAPLETFFLGRVVALERRALTFRDVHPLSLQTSPFDGVARGIIVTRSVEQTALVLRGLLTKHMEYDIVEEEENWLLVDKMTNSPVRVVSKDAVLTTAFWSEDWHA